MVFGPRPEPPTNSSSNSTARPSGPGLNSATRFYNITSQPLTALKNRRMSVPCGCVVGGSSAVNGMVFDRGSAEDYDSWVWAAGDEDHEWYGNEWGWKNILPWFKKSVTFHPPTEKMAKDYGMTWDMAAYGGNTPIHSSYPPYQWPAQREYLSRVALLRRFLLLTTSSLSLLLS